MKIIRFDILGQPPIMRRNRSKSGQRPYPTAKQRSDYERIKEAYTDCYSPLMSNKAFALGVMVVYRRDVDLGHVFNAIEDALQELVWMNDRQVQRYLASEKTKVEVGLPFTRVVIQELEHVYRS